MADLKRLEQLTRRVREAADGGKSVNLELVEQAFRASGQAGSSRRQATFERHVARAIRLLEEALA